MTRWQDELDENFGLAFDLLTSWAVEELRTGSSFAEHDRLVARLDHLARNDSLQERFAATVWDLVVVDEAHRMAAHWFAIEVRRRSATGSVGSSVG